MKIPRHWSKALGSADDPEGKRYALKIWGWSEDSVAEAAALARRRLGEASARIARGMLSRDAYFYGKTPLREEIVRVVDGASSAASEAPAVVTRNRYGALVLNAARVPFIDVDVQTDDARRGDVGGGFLGLFGRKKPRAPALLERIRTACAQLSPRSFRVYRTAAGFRVLATDLLMDPQSSEAESMLSAFGADPFFTKLCKLQASFRARLTPKPWRCGCPVPPASYPFDSPSASSAYAEWLRTYASAIASKATCSLLEVVGSGRTLPESSPVVTEHDRACRVGESLPLA